MNIGIIFGGKSYEHDISIISAFQLKKKIESKYNIHLLYLDLDNNLFIADKLSLNDFKEEKLKKLKKTKFYNSGVKGINLDIIVSVMHGENGEDGLVSDICKFYDIKYLGCDSFTGSLCLDKSHTYRYLHNTVNMIESFDYSYEDYLNDVKIPYFPCIIKPRCLGSSIGINVVKKEEELSSKLINSFEYSDYLVIQPYYENIKEYNLALNEFDYSNLECINKKDEIFSFDNKYSDSFKQMHQSLVNDERYEEFCDIARKVYNLIEAKGIIRIDFFMIEDKIYVNEVNTTPGALAMYLFADFIKVFNDSLNMVLSSDNKVYHRGEFLAKSNINK